MADAPDMELPELSPLVRECTLEGYSDTFLPPPLGDWPSFKFDFELDKNGEFIPGVQAFFGNSAADYLVMYYNERQAIDSVAVATNYVDKFLTILQGRLGESKDRITTELPVIFQYRPVEPRYMQRYFQVQGMRCLSPAVVAEIEYILDVREVAEAIQDQVKAISSKSDEEGASSEYMCVNKRTTFAFLVSNDEPACAGLMNRFAEVVALRLLIIKDYSGTNYVDKTRYSLLMRTYGKLIKALVKQIVLCISALSEACDLGKNVKYAHRKNDKFFQKWRNKIY